MRRRRSTEQRLWLGPGGYLCGGGRRFAYAYAYGDSNSHAYSDSFGITYTE